MPALGDKFNNSVDKNVTSSSSTTALTSTRAAVQALLRRPVLPRVEPLPQIGAALAISRPQTPNPAAPSSRASAVAIDDLNTSDLSRPLPPIDASVLMSHEPVSLVRMQALGQPRRIHLDDSLAYLENDVSDSW